MSLADDMPTSDAELFVKLLAMTTSAHDGECLAAIRKANTILRRNQLTWAQVFAGRGHKVPLTDKKGIVRVHVSILQVTQRAVRCRCADNLQRWIPRSQIIEPGWQNVVEGKLIEMVIPGWLAAENGIPVFRPAAHEAAQ